MGKGKGKGLEREREMGKEEVRRKLGNNRQLGWVKIYRLRNRWILGKWKN